MLELDRLPMAHLGHWIWQLLIFAPLLAIAIALVAAEVIERRGPGWDEREAEERAEDELDEILSR
jgi:hypothetical protein